jgi:hypothetical protein
LFTLKCQKNDFFISIPSSEFWTFPIKMLYQLSSLLSHKESLNADFPQLLSASNSWPSHYHCHIAPSSTHCLIVNPFVLLLIALEHGYHVSSKSVPYKHGPPYNFSKKIEVAAAIQSAQAGSRSEHLNITSVSRECKVSRT